MTTPPRVAVIGAGSSGLTALKAAKQAGLDVVCFEKGSRVGGNWVFGNDNGASSAYRSLHINTSRERMQFSDFPMPASYPDYPHHTLIARYFAAYAEAFALTPHIRFRTSVERAQPRAQGGFTLTLSDGTREDIDALIVANGHHWDPALPDPLPPGEFSGATLHSHSYVDPDQPLALRGKRVLVVGMGNSAMDIACELSHPGVAARVLLCARRGAWVLPKYAFGKPIDQNRLLPPFLPVALRRRIAELWYRFAVGKPEDFGLPRPAHAIHQAHPTISSEILDRLGAGDLDVKPEIQGFSGNEVSFVDGSRELVDAIVYATGYKVTFPFFDPAFLSAPNNDLPLYLRVFPLDREDLFFIGLCQPLGAVMPLAELQSKLVAEHLNGEYQLPARSERARRTQRARAAMLARYVPSRRHTMQVDFDDYLAELRAEAAAGRARARKRPPLPFLERVRLGGVLASAEHGEP